MTGLERLIDPVSPSDFFERHLDGEPLFCQRGDPTWFADLVTISDLDTVMSLAGHPGTLVRYLVPERTSSATQPPFSDIRQAYLKGATVVLNNLGRVWPPIARFCRQLEAVFGGAVRGNIYLTPPASRAFPPHWDAYSVFAMQLYGEKTWRLGGPKFDRPLESQYFEPPVEMPPDAQEYSLRAGDSLFVPRGYTHDVFTTDAPSVHISFGVHPPLWMDAVREAVDLAAERIPELRRILLQRPAHALDNASLSALLHEIADLALAEPAMRAVWEKALKKRPEAADHHLMDIVLGRQVAADTPLRRRPGMDATLTPEGDNVILNFPLGRVPLPARILPDLEYIIDSLHDFCPSDLPSLDEDAAVRLCRKLMEAGLLGFADGPDRPAGMRQSRA